MIQEEHAGALHAILAAAVSFGDQPIFSTPCLVCWHMKGFETDSKNAAP